MSNETVLKLGSIYLPVGSSRGISQSLELADNGELRRTVNGKLIPLTRDENRKFSCTFTASDQASPALQGIWRGQKLTVESIAVFRQSVIPADDNVTLIRDYVAGSVFGYNSADTKVLPTSIVGLLVTFPSDVVAVEFRPILTMLIADYSFDNDEYEAQEGWSVSLEEE